MPVKEELLTAMAGGGLAAEDYAGMTPEQIAAVAGQGNDQRKLMMGVVDQMNQQENFERKQSFDEQHDNRMFQLMQRQDARQEFETIHKSMLDQVRTTLEQKRLGLEAQRTNADLATNKLQQDMLSKQNSILQTQIYTVDKMQKNIISVPGLLDDKGQPVKMSIASMHSLGLLDKAIAAGLKKDLLSTAGESKQIQLRKYIGGKAKELGAKEPVVDWIEMMGPEGLKNMTPAALNKTLLDKDPLYRMASPEEQKKILQEQYGLIDVLKINVVADMAEQGKFNAGADEPGGTVPATNDEQLKQMMMED